MLAVAAAGGAAECAYRNDECTDRVYPGCTLTGSLAWQVIEVGMSLAKQRKELESHVVPSACPRAIPLGSLSSRPCVRTHPSTTPQD